MTSKSKLLFDRAEKVIPGGVNSPVRAFRAVGRAPLFIESADKATITDADGKTYIDYIGSWGPMILGHNNESIQKAVAAAAKNGLSYGAPTLPEVELAEKIISLVPDISMVRMVSSGTEAVMSAVRLARGYTGKNKIIKFEGCYHGHSDSMLVKAGSGALTAGLPDSLGVPAAFAEDTLIAQYNDLDSVERLLSAHETAGVIVEPVAANMGVVAPSDGFLKGLRELCDRYNALLIFDEVITGFRLCAGGAQEFYNVRADIVTYGKIIGGGMPVGAYAASRKIMERVAPLGGVYQAGTLSGNPVAMSAGLAQLSQLDGRVYSHIDSMGERLQSGLDRIIKARGICAVTTRVGSLACLFFGVGKAESYSDVKLADKEMYAKYFNAMLDNGIYLAPSQFEAMFISYAHQQNQIDETLNIAEKVIKELF